MIGTLHRKMFKKTFGLSMKELISIPLLQLLQDKVSVKSSVKLYKEIQHVNSAIVYPAPSIEGCKKLDRTNHQLLSRVF